MSRATIILGAVLAVVAAAATGYGFGHADGKAAQIADHNAEALRQVRDQLTAHDGLVKRSIIANKALRDAMQQRKKGDQQSSEVLTHELNSTADSRAGCVFPSGVMRELSAARDRAAEAAASGISGTLPATTTGPKGER